MGKRKEKCKMRRGREKSIEGKRRTKGGEI